MELMEQLDRQAGGGRDLVVRATGLMVNAGAEEAPYAVIGDGVQHEPLSDVAQEQLAEYLDIPRKYWKHMAANAPHLIGFNADEWLRQKGGLPNGKGKRLVRLNHQGVRAVLSTRYRRLDHMDVLKVAIPSLREVEAEPWPRYTLTDQRMHVTFVCKQLVAELGGRDAMGAGHTIKRFEKERLMAALTISNSEVGRGGLVLRLSLVAMGCTNLAILEEMVRVVHLGRELSEGWLDMASDQTNVLADALLLSKMRDAIGATFNQLTFEKLVGRVQTARDVDVLEPAVVLKRIAGKEGLDENALLQAYMQQPEPSAWGVVQAITRTANEVGSASEAGAEASRLGGKVLGLDIDDMKAYFKSDKKTLGAGLAEEETDTTENGN